VLLHLAGVYDDQRCVPTLAQQIARIYERDAKSYLYAGNPEAGQAAALVGLGLPHGKVGGRYGAWNRYIP
jgi:hypothetical protein